MFDLFKEIEEMSKPKLPKYPVVNPVDKFPIEQIKPDIKDGPWIAGGAALHWYQNSPVGLSDIDVFCADAQQAENLITKLKSLNSQYVRYLTKNATTLELKKDNVTWSIQVITKRYYENAQEVIDSFDISVCQILTDGNQWLLNPMTAKDIREKNLRFTKLQPDALKRLTKYWIYGYRPVDGTFDLICNNPDAKWTFNLNEEYDDALIP